VTRPVRRLHLLIWVILAPLIVAGFAIGTSHWMAAAPGTRVTR